MGAGVTPKVLAVIPARYASQRFPGKVLAPLGGKPLVAHTVDRTRQAQLVDEVVVAVDDPRVEEVLTALDIPVVMTRPEHPSGTDRIAEVAESHDASIIVNVQGDEPLIDPATIDAAIRPLLEDDNVPMSTAKHRIINPDDAQNPNVVKVVCDSQGRALYFSRAPIPFPRDDDSQAEYWQHIGLYVYQRDFLLQYAQMSPSALEMCERLEQLRVLENGYSITVVETEYISIGVDTPEDLELVRTQLESKLERA